MYYSDKFNFPNEEEMLSMLREHCLAVVILTSSEGKVKVDHIPLFMDWNRKALYGHLAKQNPHSDYISCSIEAKAIFTGPNSYISPRWLDVKGIVPTWNYTTVHISGKPKLITDDEALTIMRQQVNWFEKHATNPWDVNNLSKDRLTELLKYIVNFKIDIETIESKAKLHQNHNKENQLSVVSGLEKEMGYSGKILANIMKQYLML